MTDESLNYRYKNGLTRRHIIFCDEYLKNGHHVLKAALKVGYGGKNRRAAYSAGWAILKKPLIKKYINKRVKTVEKKFYAGFEQKYSKLWQVATICTPDDAKTKEEIDGRTTVAAVTEMNKMTGDQAPEKRVTLNLKTDSDILKIKEVQANLLEKHRKEY